MTRARTGVAAAAPDWVDGKLTFPLSKPIPDPEVEGGVVAALTLREPTGADMVEAGNPVEFNPVADPPRIAIDEKKMARMISRLSALPPSVIGRMAPRDMVQVSWALAPFFVPV